MFCKNEVIILFVVLTLTGCCTLQNQILKGGRFEHLFNSLEFKNKFHSSSKLDTNAVYKFQYALTPYNGIRYPHNEEAYIRFFSNGRALYYWIPKDSVQYNRSFNFQKGIKSYYSYSEKNSLSFYHYSTNICDFDKSEMVIDSAGNLVDYREFNYGTLKYYYKKDPSIKEDSLPFQKPNW